METFLQTPWELFLVQQWIFLSVLSHYPSAKEKKMKWTPFIIIIIIVIALLESTLPCKLTEVTSKFLKIFQNSCEILHKINNRNERESWYILSHSSFEDCNDISISTKTAFPFLQFQGIIWAVETLYFALCSFPTCGIPFNQPK